MIIKKQLKNGKVSVTSSHFADMGVYRQSLAESMQEDYVPMKWRKTAGRDFSELKRQTTIQCLILAKQGSAELSDFVNNLKDNQLEHYVINWGPWKPYESYEDLCKKRDEFAMMSHLNEEDQAEFDRVVKEIKSIDDFVDSNMEAMRQGYSLNPAYLKDHPECAMPKKEFARPVPVQC